MMQKDHWMHAAFAVAIFFLNECHRLFFCWFFFSPNLFRPCLGLVCIPDGHRFAIAAHSAPLGPAAGGAAAASLLLAEATDCLIRLTKAFLR